MPGDGDRLIAFQEVFGKPSAEFADADRNR